MNEPVFTGAAVAIATPFTQDGTNYDVLEELIEFQIENSIDCILICGTTGEASTMPDEEHKAAISFTVKKVDGRVPVIAGTGSNDTRHAIELSRYAQEAGADAILTVTPYYNKTSQKGLYEHFRSIAQSVSIPVILYNVPTRTVMNIDPQTVKRLYDDTDNIVAIKECNLSQVGNVARLCGPGFSIYSGDDSSVLPMLAYGGRGVISVAANLVPADMHELVDSFFQGDVEKSRSIQLKLLPLIQALFSEVNPMPVKTALGLMGFDVGICRLPLTQLSAENLKELTIELENYGILE